MNAKTVVFFCNWSAYPGLQMSRNPLEESKDSQKLLVSMCSGRVSSELIIETFSRGAWGVLVTACPPDSCEHDGNYKTVARIKLVKNMLAQMGVDPGRLKMEWIDKGESAKLQQAMDVFAKEIEALGPLAL